MSRGYKWGRRTFQAEGSQWEFSHAQCASHSLALVLSHLPDLGLWPSAIGVESGLCWSESTLSAHCESHIRAHGHWWSWCPPPIPGLMDIKCVIETGSLQACWAAIEQLFLYSTDQAGILAQSLSQHKGQWLLGRRCGEDQIYLWAFRHFSLKSQDLGQALKLTCCNHCAYLAGLNGGFNAFLNVKKQLNRLHMIGDWAASFRSKFAEREWLWTLHLARSRCVQSLHLPWLSSNLCNRRIHQSARHDREQRKAMPENHCRPIAWDDATNMPKEWFVLLMENLTEILNVIFF